MLKVPETKRAELNRIRLFLAMDIDAMLIKARGKSYTIDSFKVLDAPENHRYIKFEIDGVEQRFNYKSKSEFIDSNYYWLRHKRCKKNYKNTVALRC